MTKHIVSQRLSVHQQHELLLVLEKAGLTDELAQAIIQSPDNALAKHIVKIVQENAIDFKTFHVLVDYYKSVSELVKAGRYAWIDPEFNSAVHRFKGTNSGVYPTNIQLLRFGRLIATSIALGEMYKMKFRPATVYELLSLGAKRTDFTFQIAGIVALGNKFSTASGGGDLVAAIYLCHGQPDLRLIGMHESLWGKDWYFAAVKQ